MKTFLFITLISALFTGCSSSNAFSRFNISQEQAKSENSVSSAKIFSKEEAVGVLSTLYLNQILPITGHKNERFYVSIYTKKDLQKIEFFLNGQEASSVKELEPKNEFSHLLSSNEKWKKYYLVEFNKLGEKLNFILKSNQYSSEVLSYTKED